MERLIHFNDMIDILSQKEYESFIQELTKNRDSFKSLLFHLCVCELFAAQNKINKNVNSDLSVDNMNHMISTIIQKRKESNDIDKEIKLKIDAIPKEMICEISSFLSVNENINFSVSNKFIFIASRSPTKINEINREEMQKYDTYFTENCKLPKITMDKFKNTTSLSLNCTHYTAIHYLSMCPSIWNNLTTLNLYHCNVPDLFINANHLNIQLSNIKTLKLYDIHSEIYDESTNVEEGEEFCSLIKLLSQFKNIEFLDLSMTHCVPDIFAERIIDIPSISSLRGIGLVWILPESISNVLLTAYSKQLESLHIGHNDGIFGYIRESFPDHVKKYKFENIKELCINGDVEKEDVEILKTVNCNTLKRIYVSTMNPHHVPIPIFLFYSPSLQYISLNEKSVRRSIDALIEATKIKRYSIKIKVAFNCNTKDWQNGINVQFMNLLNNLRENTQHFMLILDGCSHLKFNRYFNGLKQKYTVNQYDGKLIISNFGCNLNGYQQKWLMQCSWCNH